MTAAAFTCAVGDMGGANVVAPVARGLGGRGHRVRVFVNETLARTGAVLPDFGTPPAVLDDAALAGLFGSGGKNTDGVLVATASRAGNREKQAVQRARAGGWPTVSPVENWGPFYSRFSDIAEGTFVNRLAYLPDHVLVVDAFARDRAIEEGVPADNVTVMGSPHLETVVAAGCAWTPADAAHLRGRLGAGEGRRMALFASQALSREMGRNSPEFPGYDEFDCLTTVCEALAAEWPDALLVIKLHPFETQADFRLPAAAGRLDIRIVQDIPAWDLARSADLVMGANTMLLMEAVAWGKPVASVQPQARRAEDFIGTRLGVVHTCTDADSLRQVLRRGAPPVSGASDRLCLAAQGATERIVDFLERLSR